MLQLFLSGIIKPLVFPLYCCVMWTLAGLFLWSIWKAGKDGTARLRRLHQVPCTHCAFFTGDYRLKCTVHPIKALTEEAINCLDYEPTTNRTTVYRKRCKCLENLFPEIPQSAGQHQEVLPNSKFTVGSS